MKDFRYESFFIGMMVGLILSLAVFGCMYNGERAGNQFRESGDTVVVAKLDTLTEWDMLQLAIIKTESGFRQYAIGDSGDLGLYQMTEVYVEDVNRIAGERLYTHDDAFDIRKAMEMFDIYQKHYNPDMDAEKAIRLHNPGGDSIGYMGKVIDNMNQIRKYERIRQNFTHYDD